MRLSEKITYPTGDPAEAFALVVDPDFRAEVCEALHALENEVSVDEHDDGAVTVTVTRVMAADLPPAFKKMVGDTVTVVQTEKWSGPDDSGRRIADLLIKISGQPVTLTGTIDLASAGGSVISAINGELKVSIPFFGKKLEPDIATAIHAAIEQEQSHATQRLSR